VIVPANTYIATALAVSETGGQVVLADCLPRTYNIDPDAVASAMTERTTVILPVHFAGQAADMDAVFEIAKKGGVDVIEDAAQAHGATWAGHPCGSLGKLGCFSFYPSKNLGALGDAGMVTTNDSALADRIRRLRNYGERRKYDHVVKGVNSRLDGIQAAFLSIKLSHLAAWNAARVEHANEYSSELVGVGDLILPEVSSGATHVYHLYIIETRHRDALQSHLDERGIRTGIHYPKPIHLQEAYSDLGLGPGTFPVAERLAQRTLSLPMYPELSSEQIGEVVAAIRDFFAHASRRR
jgi:dTDP-4-amino-4,6-dideoxygalactose transaminase